MLATTRRRRFRERLDALERTGRDRRRPRREVLRHRVLEPDGGAPDRPARGVRIRARGRRPRSLRAAQRDARRDGRRHGAGPRGAHARAPGRRRDPDRISGSVVKVLDRARERVVGRFETEEGHKVVLPYDPKIDAIVRIADGKARGAREGEIVEARVTSFPDARRSRTASSRSGSGFWGSRAWTSRSCCARTGFRPRFPQPVVEESEAFPEEVRAGGSARAGGTSATAASSRSTARPRRTSTTRSKSSERPAASASASTSRTSPTTSRRGTALDDEARSRGTSVYFPGRVLPMLPGAALQRPLLLEPARGPARPLRDPRDSTGKGRVVSGREFVQGRDPERAPDDLHGGRAAARDEAELGGRAPLRRASSRTSGRWGSSPPCSASGARPGARSTSTCRMPTSCWTTRGSSSGSCRSRATSRTG